MKRIKILLVLFAFANMLAACKKDKDLTELEKLPPATQTGANTFGCLVNGKAWVAQRNDCNILCDPSFKLNYDPANGGNIGIKSVQIQIQSHIDESILIGFDSTNFKSDFVYSNLTQLSIGFTYIKDLVYVRSWDPDVSCTGFIKLTKYDIQQGIFSGIFEFRLVKTNGNTITVTDGRFDKKL